MDWRPGDWIEGGSPSLRLLFGTDGPSIRVSLGRERADDVAGLTSRHTWGGRFCRACISGVAECSFEACCSFELLGGL
jgi:hypothetical protein